MKNVVFFGDSFAGSSKHIEYATPQQFCELQIRCWQDIVAQRIKRYPVIHGYGGVGWWYSYRKLRSWIDLNPKSWENTDTMVFTLGMRHLPYVTDQDAVRAHLDGKYKALGHNIWVEDEFDVWVYEKFIDELIEWSKTRKVVVFYNFRQECWLVNKLKDHVAICLLPLMYLTCAEADLALGRIEYVPNQANHFNDLNNLGLANEIHKQLIRNKPGMFMLDPANFDLKRPDYFDQWVDIDYNYTLEQVYLTKINKL